jgi:hypothetical protein
MNKIKKNKFIDLEGSTPLKYEIFRKALISPEPRIGKFQICAEMKVNYPTNKENIRMDFSDNFHNIKNFVQIDHLARKILIIPLIFPFYRSRKMAGGQKNFPDGKNKHKYMPDSHVKILSRSDYHTLPNLTSNTIEKKEPEMSRLENPFEISFI